MKQKNHKLTLIALFIICLCIIAIILITYFKNINEQKNQASTGNTAIKASTDITQTKSDKIVYSEKSNSKLLVNAVDLVGNKKLIYSSSDKQPQVNLLNNGSIYVTQYPGYKLFDLNGIDLTDKENIFLKDSVELGYEYNGIITKSKLSPGFFLTSNSSNKTIYTNDYRKGNEKKVFILDTKTKEKSEITINLKYSGSAPSAIKPITWGLDDSVAYMKFTGWEGVDNNEVFKVNLKSKLTTRLSSFDSIPYSTFKIYPKQDLILAANNSAESNAGMNVLHSGPSELFLINTNTDSKESLLKSDKFISASFLSSNGNQILYQEKEDDFNSSKYDEKTGEYTNIDYIEPKILSTKIYDRNKKTTTDLKITDEVLYCSSDLKTILLKNNQGNLSLYNFKTKKTVLKLQDKNKEYEFIGGYNIN